MMGTQEIEREADDIDMQLARLSERARRMADFAPKRLAHSWLETALAINTARRYVRPFMNAKRREETAA